MAIPIEKTFSLCIIPNQLILIAITDKQLIQTRLLNTGAPSLYRIFYQASGKTIAGVSVKSITLIYISSTIGKPIFQKYHWKQLR
jgi:hypothetical protein